MEDPEGFARAICLRLLTGAPRTRAELATALRRRGAPDDVAAPVLDRLTEVGLIDDAAYARAWVSSRQAGRGLGRRALAEELTRKGVDRTLVAEVVSCIDDDDELATARALAARRARLTRDLPTTTRHRRLVGLLARRGYSAAVIARVADDVLRADSGDAGSEAGAGF